MDIIRVIRIYEFVGPRDVVEEQVSQSIQGEKRVDKRHNMKGPLIIRAATLGTFPEVLDAEKASDYNLHVYACGYRDNVQRETYGIFAGPFYDLEDAMQAVPQDGREAVLLRFDGRDEHVVLFWYSYDIGTWLPWVRSREMVAEEGR